MIPTALMVAYTSVALNRAALRISMEEANRTLDSVTAQQSLIVKQAEQTIRTIAESDEVRDSDMEALSHDLAAVLRRNSFYSTITAFSPEGQALASGQTIEPYSISDRDYFATLKKTGDVSIGAAARSRATGLMMIPVAYPVTDEQERLKLILTVGIRTTAIREAFMGFKMPDGMSLEMVDRDGVLLVRLPQKSADVQIGMSEEARLFTRAALEDSNILRRNIQLDLGDRPSFRIAVSIHEPRIAGYPSTRQLILIAAISLVASIALANFLYSRSIGKRIDDLIALAENMGGLHSASFQRDLKSRNELVILERTLKESRKVLSEHEAEMREAAKAIQASLKEKDALIKEIHHRVKNNFQVISSLLSLRAMDIEDDVVLRMLEESRNRIQSMSLIHEQLYQTGVFSRIDFGDYSRSLADQIALTYRDVSPDISLRIAAGHAPLSIDAAVPLGLIINEILSNCFKHAFPGKRSGSIEIRLEHAGPARARVVVADDGVGMPGGSAQRRAGGLGFDLINTLVEQLRASLAVGPARPEASSPGTRFEIEFALPPDENWTEAE